MKIACSIWLALAAILHASGLDFPTTIKEIHAPADAKTVTADFEFSNQSDKPVRIREYKSTCSCMSVQIQGSKLRYAPGETGLIRANFEMGNFSGVVDKVVAIWLDDDRAEEPSLALTVRVHIPVLVSLEPKTLKWELNGEAAAQTVRIEMHHTKPIHISSVISSSEAFTTTLKTIEEGKSYELSVTPENVTNPGLAILRIETDCEMEKYRMQQVFAVVRKLTPGEASAAKP